MAAGPHKKDVQIRTTARKREQSGMNGLNRTTGVNWLLSVSLYTHPLLSA